MGIVFLRKNKIDLDYSGITITITDAVADDNGEDFVDFLRNRNNTSGWATTNSTDAANTQIDIDMGSRKDVNRIGLWKMNFKNYVLWYYDEDLTAWTIIETVTNNTIATKLHSFATKSARYFRIVISGTMTADDDKYMTQLIITESLGEFSFQPRVKPIIDRNRKATKYLSGKSHIIKSVTAFQCDVEMQSVTSDTDLTLVETLFDSYEGFLVWLCGGTTSQFDTQRVGWRLEDIFLVNVGNEYRPEWGQSRYKNGIEVDLRLLEVI